MPRGAPLISRHFFNSSEEEKAVLSGRRNRMSHANGGKTVTEIYTVQRDAIRGKGCLISVSVSGLGEYHETCTDDQVIHCSVGNLLRDYVIFCHLRTNDN